MGSVCYLIFYCDLLQTQNDTRAEKLRVLGRNTVLGAVLEVGEELASLHQLKKHVQAIRILVSRD
jgi:hypothetical protein